MNGPSARALREGGIGGSLSYKKGTTLLVRLSGGGPPPAEWKKKTTLQGTFGEFGQILRIDIQEAQGAAYVEYDDKDDAEEALRVLVGGNIAGRPVHIQMAHAPQQMSVTARTLAVEEQIATMARSYRLDEAATARLVSVFGERGRLGCDLEKDCQELSEHLAASNKPSALVSMRLADLRAGRPIGPCKYRGQPPAPGPLGLRLDRGGEDRSRSRRDDGLSGDGNRDKAGLRGEKAERAATPHGRSRDRTELNGKANVASSSASRGTSRQRGRRKSRSRSRRRAAKSAKRKRSSSSKGRGKAATKSKRKLAAKKKKACSSAAGSSLSREDSSSEPQGRKDKQKKSKSKRSASSDSSASKRKRGKKSKAKK